MAGGIGIIAGGDIVEGAISRAIAKTMNSGVDKANWCIAKGGGQLVHQGGEAGPKRHGASAHNHYYAVDLGGGLTRRHKRVIHTT